MKNSRIFLACLLMVAVIISLTGAACVCAQGMMGGDGMREMMQNMMGDMLPPPMDPGLLSDPDSQGARLLRQFCTQCHYLPGPGLHTAIEWPAVVQRMDRRMQMMSRHGMMMGRIKAPDEQELATLLGYLQAHAQKPLATRLAPSLETPAGKAFRSVCSQCHTLPDPGQHNAKGWPGVVERMKGYMKSMGKQVPDEETQKVILGFLQRNAYSGK
jgi:cytochrome c2